MKKLFFTLSVILLSISFYPVKAMEKTADILKKNVVTSGDGLYVDSTIDGRYIYRGGNPNNYIKLGDDLYRIISVEKDGTIKVVKQDSIGETPWDKGDSRPSKAGDDFCYSTGSLGCKVWGSNETMLDESGNKVIQMSWEIGGNLKNLPEKESTLNTYLNNDFYNGLSDNIKEYIKEKYWGVGVINYNQEDLKESVKEETAYKWKGKVALISAIDYIKGSNNSACISIKDYYYANGNSSCYNNSETHNYLYPKNSEWTISSYSENANRYNSSITTGRGYLGYQHTWINMYVRPAFYLSSETTLNGEGTETNPYTVSKYVEETKDEENNNEVDIDNRQLVEVPSTSAQMSIIIASIGIIFISLAVIITKKMTKNKRI